MSSDCKTCKICNKDVEVLGVCCDVCDIWHHNECEGVVDDVYKVLTENQNLRWFCSDCIKKVGKGKMMFVGKIRDLQKDIGELRIEAAEIEKKVRRANVA